MGGFSRDKCNAKNQLGSRQQQRKLRLRQAGATIKIGVMQTTVTGKTSGNEPSRPGREMPGIQRQRCAVPENPCRVTLDSSKEESLIPINPRKPAIVQIERKMTCDDGLVSRLVGNAVQTDRASVSIIN